ncbi:DNA polymerase III subunit beta [Xanthobacter sp. DSM 24535]|uniref:DNA polymerase III subunit beta n=1 Tax=Roseixanthobacter psychrophilus TaxID=3119917 RepID=UPI00372793C3
MKLSLSRDALAGALERIHKLVERRNTIPILSHIKVSAFGETLGLTATDLDITGTTEIAAEIEHTGAMTVPADTLFNFVRKLPDGTQISLTGGDGDTVTIRCGKSRATLPTLDPADFPDAAKGEWSHSFALDSHKMAEMIDRVEFAISTEGTRYYLNGIFLHLLQDHADGLVLRAVATDGHRLARYQMAAPEGTGGEPFGVIIPRKAVAEMAKLAKIKGEAKVQVSVSKTLLRVAAGVTTITTKLIDGTFPDYNRVIPSGNSKAAVLDKAQFAAAVSRVSTLSTERGRAVKFSFSDSALTLSVVSPDTGTAVDEMEAAYDAEPLDIGFNSAYLADICSVAPGDRLRVMLEDAGSPALITAEGDATSLFVLMPMRA